MQIPSVRHTIRTPVRHPTCTAPPINQHHFPPRVNSEPRRASPSILLSSTQRRTRQTTHAQNPPCLCKQTSGKSVVRPPCRPERTCIPREPLRKGKKVSLLTATTSLDSHPRLKLAPLVVLLRTKSPQPQAAVWHREDPARCERSSFSVQQSGILVYLHRCIIRVPFRLTACGFVSILC